MSCRAPPNRFRVRLPGKFVKCSKMPSIRGFSLRKHIFRFTKCVPRRPRVGNRFGDFGCVSRKLLNFFKINPKFICTGFKSGNYVTLGREHGIMDDDGCHGAVPPKGQMAVYVGREDGSELRRVLVPVVYFNDPLFRELLRDAEEKYGFCQQGGIKIPCGVSEFERVRTRVAAAVCHRGGGGPRRKMIAWRKAVR